MLITITWKAGSGKSTAAKLLAEKLWYKYISIWDMKRKIAEYMWINIIKFNELGELPENQKEFDLKYEEYQKNLDSDSKIILESRLGYFCQPKSLKIFISVDDESAAKRIFNDHRSTDKYSSREEAYEETKKRNREDVERYQKLYGINYQDPKNFDLIFDTTGKTLDETVLELIEIIEEYKKNQQK